MPLPKMLLATALLSATHLGAQTSTSPNAPPKWADTISSEINAADLASDAPRLHAARALAERVAIAYPNDGLILHYLGFATFLEAEQLVSRGADASAPLKEAAAVLERSLEKRPLAETQMLLASIDGQLIAGDPSRAMELGMAVQAATAAAMSLGPTNPRVWLLRGMNAIFTPPEYGGGLDVARDHLTKAIDLFAKDSPKPGEPRWGGAEVRVWLGQVYQKQGDKAKAIAEYRAALAIEPGYAWPKAMLSAAQGGTIK